MKGPRAGAIPIDVRTRQGAGICDALRMIAGTSPGGEYREGAGVASAIVPAAPRDELLNVTLLDGGSPHALTEARTAYAVAGVRDWSLWVYGDVPATRDALRRGGFEEAARLPAMVLDLSEWRAGHDLAGIDWDADGSIRDVAEVNASAYERPGIAAALQHPPSGLPTLSVYRARVGGKVAAVVCAIRHDHPQGADLGVSWVATLPHRRRLGLGTKLLVAALRDAQRQGCATSTLQASRAGQGLYRGIGYMTAGTVGVYRRETDDTRPAEDGGHASHPDNERK